MSAPDRSYPSSLRAQRSPADSLATPRLSLCLIAKDEARQIERCLASVRDVVDELIVVDTGSRDATPAIAAALGAHVSSAPWSDDFAAARNASLARATGDWVLVLDADEALTTAPDRARALLIAFARRAAACGPLPRAGRIAIHSIGDPDADGVVSITRFFPRRANIHFRGRVHEQLVDEDRAAAPLSASDLDIAAAHTGYAAATLADRHKLARNIALGELAVRDEPDDGYLWYQLGRARALAADLSGALADFERALARCPDGAPWGPSLVEAAAYALRGAGHSQRALALVEALLATVPDRPDTWFLAALCAADTGAFERAEFGYRRCLELGPQPPGPVESSPSAATWAPAHNLGVLCEVLGRQREALEWYERALELRPGHAASREGLERVA